MQAVNKTPPSSSHMLLNTQHRCMQEAGTGFASKPQTDDAEPGDIALDSWVRSDASFQTRSE